MTTTYAVREAGGPVTALDVEQPPLGPLEVDVRVTHCGICHTDLGMIDNEFGISTFPLVAGHEAVGVVSALGDAVPPGHLHVGQRVGVGAIAGSCFACEWCLSGRQSMCPQKDDTVLRGTGGGFARTVRAGDWRHVHVIPDEIASVDAGPLLCAGTTVFAPLVRHDVKPTDRVAVVGVGGLGHLAIQFLAAWGCHVTAVSTTEAKAADARELGANDFVTSAGDGLDRVASTFDFVLSTVSANLPWDRYLATVRPRGVLCSVGIVDEPISFHPINLLPAERSVAGGVVGSLMVTRQMLGFAARHGIRPRTEVFPVERIDEALDHVRRGKPRYRAVLEF
ncbi:NAD(P)-dependent alcohol dehydrogenase [Actinoplanes sp. NPDC049265]|uniref:NAD(P)-dependent alcohol dehydrogenase n=1 Tax=Actinoplanes sp. NPDC049265 TaxID=3363902 RepID=UPI0037116406